MLDVYAVTKFEHRTISITFQVRSKHKFRDVEKLILHKCDKDQQEAHFYK
jgi:hypothetical protein